MPTDNEPENEGRKPTVFELLALARADVDAVRDRIDAAERQAREQADRAKPHEDAHAAANLAADAHEPPVVHNEITLAKIAAQDEDLIMRSFKVVE